MTKNKYFNKKKGFNKKGGKGESNKDNTKTKTKTKLEDFVFYTGSASSAADFEVTKEFIVNHIRTTYSHYAKDIASAIEKEEETKLTEPILKYSKSADADQKLAENKAFEIQFTQANKVYTTRVTQYEDNKTNAYGLLFGRCSKTMQAKLKARSDFADMRDDPVKLIKAIKQHALNYSEHRYKMKILYESFFAMFNCRQKEKESLNDYSKRFTTAKDVMESHNGGIISLFSANEENPKYQNGSDAEKAAIEAATYEAFCAYIYFHNADPKKYGSLQNRLDQDFSLTTDLYPKTLTSVTTTLGEHKLDNRNKNDGKDTKSNDKKPSNNDDKPKKEKEKDSEPVELSYAQSEGRCFNCGKRGHFSNSDKCPEKGRPKKDWWITQVEGATKQSYHQQSDAANETALVPFGGAQIQVNYIGAHVGTQLMHAPTNMRNVILCDNESSALIFCNEDFVYDIQDSTKKLTLSTNGGNCYATKTALVPGFPNRVWFNPDSMTNILAFHEMAKVFRIQYDNTKEDVFVVHMDPKPIKFVKADNGLYIYRPFPPVYKFNQTTKKPYSNSCRSATTRNSEGEHSNVLGLSDSACQGRT